MKEEIQDACPCKSGKTYAGCCGPIHSGAAKAATAEALMRARYSAYAKGEVDFLRTSSTVEAAKDFDEAATRDWCDAAEWHGLEVIATERGGERDAEGVVEFRALYTTAGKFCNHHERATFVRENGEWKFADGEFVKETPVRRETERIGRNDPCPCGSGKKYKKCCGA